MKYLVPLISNMGSTEFMAWLDTLHKDGFEICWRATDLLCWAAHTHPIDRWFDTEPTDEEIEFQFNEHDRHLIKINLGVDSVLNIEHREVYLIVPKELLTNTDWAVNTIPEL